MSLQTAILALTPAMYWRLNEAAGSTTVADSAGGGFPGTVTGDVQLGVTGPEKDRTALRLFTGGLVRSPAWGSSVWSDFTVMFMATVPAVGGISSFSNVLRIGDPANPNTRGFRIQYASTGLDSAQFQFIGSVNASNIATPFPRPGWHLYTYVYRNTTPLITPYVDGTLLTTTSGTPGAAWSSSDPWQLTATAPIVISDVAVYSRVLTQTEIQTVSTQIQTWPYEQAYNKLPASEEGTGGLTEEQAAQLARTDTTTQTIETQTVQIPYIVSTTNTIQGTTDTIHGQTTVIETDTQNMVNTLFPQLATVVNDIGAQINQVLDGITTTIQNAGGSISTTIGKFFEQHSHDVFGQFNPTAGATCDPIDVDISGAAYFGMRLTVTTRPTHYWPLTPDNEWTYPDLAVIRIYLEDKMILRVPIHNNTYTLRPLPQLYRYPSTLWLLEQAPPDYHIKVDWGDGVCGYIELDYLP